jgi:biopolymer transport protein ExbD
MRPSLQEKLEQSHSHGIDFAPMLDVVFNLLIFFVVTSVFIKQTGVEVEKPESTTEQVLDNELITLGITADGDVLYDSSNIGVDGVRATVEALLQVQERPVVIQADRQVPTELLVRVMDEAALAGAMSLSIATVQAQ